MVSCNNYRQQPAWDHVNACGMAVWGRHVVTGDGEPPLAHVDSLEKTRLTGDRIIVLGYRKSCHVEEGVVTGQETWRDQSYRRRILLLRAVGPWNTWLCEAQSLSGVQQVLKWTCQEYGMVSMCLQTKGSVVLGVSAARPTLTFHHIHPLPFKGWEEYSLDQWPSKGGTCKIILWGYRKETIKCMVILYTNYLRINLCLLGEYSTCI